ncbi:hypothetical protein [Streptomonospora alba]|nr:hypothetical protein [Streptomonospora alba]
MRVRLCSKLFEADGHSRQIYDLIQEFVRGRHDWVIDPRDAVTAGDYCHRNFGRLGSSAAEFARKASVNQAWAGSGATQPPVNVTSETLHDDVHDLRQSAYLIVEDRYSDRSFLVAVAHVLDGNDVLRALSTNHLELQHGGGSGRVKDHCAEDLNRFRRTKRVAVLLDSDRLQPGQSTKSHRTADELRQLGAWVHVLELREAENYVPNKVLAAVTPHKQVGRRIDALKLLSAQQRGYFDMKKGFAGKPQPSTNHGDLYSDLEDTTVDVLGSGFGDNLTKLLEREAAPGKITASDFESIGKGVVEELRGLLAMLRRII